MKKRIKALVSMLTAIAVLVLLPSGNTLPVRAAEPTTYSVQFMGGTINQWRFVYGSTFDTAQAHMGAVILPTLLKDGDNVVVYNGTDAPTKELDLGTVKLNSLTVHQNATAIIFTGGVTDCYVLAGSYCAINGDVTNAYIYDNATCTFNNNVLEMNLYYSNNSPTANLSCNGTVGHFYVGSITGSKFYEYYSVSQGALLLKNGNAQVPADKYSLEPTAEYLALKQGASVPENTANTGSSEYDDVPKTGDYSGYLFLFFVSAACFTGSFILRKKSR